MRATEGRLRAWAFAVLATPALLACPSSPFPEAQADLSRAPARAAAAVPAQPAKLRFSVAAMLSPQDTFESYSALFGLLGKRLGVEIEFVQRRTYREVNDLLATGQVDAAIVCTGGYLELERRFPGRIEVLAVPVVSGSSTYRSYVIAPAASGARSLGDFAGKRFAYTDELSLSGRGYAIYWLRQRKLDPMNFFGAVQLTHSHDRSIEAVANGVVDGAVVDSLVYDAMVARRPALAKAVRIVEASPPFGAAPVVASALVPAGRRTAIRDALLSLDRDAEAAPALAAVGIERFATPAHGLYDGARAVMGATW
jgi:phosphonate transport system substrate-binding protein